MTEKKIKECSFCNENENNVESLIAGNEGYICNSCVVLCNDILSSKENSQKTEVERTISDPKEIFSELNNYVISQEQAKKTISVAITNHYKRLHFGNKNEDLRKSNVLIIGPTGSGKTLFSEVIAKLLNIPYVQTDATSLTESGYVGDDVESLIQKLYANSGYDVEKTEKGIVYIDEIDKISAKSENMNTTSDVGREGVQQALLKLIDGSEVSFPPNGGRKNPQQEMVTISTKNILFICGGAFVGLEKVIDERLDKSKTSIGFLSETNNFEKNKDDSEKNQKVNFLEKLEDQDLIKYGLIPELKGRLPVVATLKNLTKDDLIKILTEPKGSLVSQYKHIFSYDSIELDFESDALSYIAELAIEKKTGARGLRSIMEKGLEDLMFNIQQLKDNNISKVVISKDYLKNNNIETILSKKSDIAA